VLWLLPISTELDQNALPTQCVPLELFKLKLLKPVKIVPQSARNVQGLSKTALVVLLEHFCTMETVFLHALLLTLEIHYLISVLSVIQHVRSVQGLYQAKVVLAKVLSLILILNVWLLALLESLKMMI